MSSEKKRVQFRAPNRLVDRADAIATTSGSDRTHVLVTALRECLRDATHGDGIEREIAAYCDDELSFDRLSSLVGAEKAANFRALKRQLEGDDAEELTAL